MEDKVSDKMKNESGVPFVCMSCKEGEECLFDRIWPGIESWLQHLDDSTTNSAKRKKAYMEAILEEHGYLGKNNRAPVPICTRNRIRDKFPDDEGSYMGHKES